MIFTTLRLFRLRRFRQQASQRCHSFLPRASMSPCHKMFHFTPRLAPDFPWLRRLYHVAVQSMQLFSLKPAGLATSQQHSWVMWCDRSMRPDDCMMTSKSPPSDWNHANQGSGQKHLDLLASYIPDIWQSQAGTVRANQFFFWQQKTQAMYTMQMNARHTDLQVYYHMISRPPARQHPHNQLPCLRASLETIETCAWTVELTISLSPKGVAFNRTNPKSLLDLFDIQVKPRDRPRVDRKPLLDCWYKIIWGIP